MADRDIQYVLDEMSRNVGQERKNIALLKDAASTPYVLSLRIPLYLAHTDLKP